MAGNGYVGVDIFGISVLWNHHKYPHAASGNSRPVIAHTGESIITLHTTKAVDTAG
jgi:hypothetical protein